MVVDAPRFVPDRSGVRVSAMEEFANILQRDYGLKPKSSAPMAAVRGAGGLGALGAGSSNSNENGSRRDAVGARRNGAVPGRGSVLETGADEFGEDGLFASVGIRPSARSTGDDSFGLPAGTGYGDVFGGPPNTKYGSAKYSSMSSTDDIFRVGSKSQAGLSKSSNLPVYDKPLYDDDFFGGVPGVRTPASTFDDVFGGAGGPVAASSSASSTTSAVDDFLGGFPVEERKPKTAGPSARGGSRGPGSLQSARSLGRETLFEDLLSGESSKAGRKASSRASNRGQKQPSDSGADPSQERSSFTDPIISIMQQNSASVRLGTDAVEGSSERDKPALAGSDEFAPSSFASARSSRRGGLRKDTVGTRSDSSLRREGSGPPHYGNDMDRPSVIMDTERSDLPAEEVWITVDDVKLITTPSSLPPPVRPAPVVGEDRSGSSPQHGFWGNRDEQPRQNTGRETDTRTSQRQSASSSWGVGAAAEAVAAAAASGIDGLEEFISGVLSKSGGSSSPEEEVRSDADGAGSHAAMKEAMERAEVKLRVAKEARARDREEKQREAMIARAIAREKEEKEAREEKEREKQRREREKERETEREKDRAAERAAERAAAERAAAEARERAERAAVERAAAEARERAAAEAARKAAAERAAAERAAAEARERAERAAAERAKDQQRKSDNDFDRLFSTRPTSEPRRPVDHEQTSDQRASQTFGSDGQQRRASSSTTGIRRVSSTTNIDNDLTSLFNSPAQDEFQEIEGETADRRKARWERHQRTTERATKALQEKKQRELEMQREQAEKHRAGEVLDTEIKRWAAGKEGNLRALLSTLQYVLWPECGWLAVSLTDLITGAAVKKAYRKATLCVHPDKVQQKGATVQQKYIAEKVFDLLKEAWNKFNSEELF